MLGKDFMKIGPTVGKIQTLKCFIITVMGAAILIWQSCDQFLKIDIYRRISICKAQFWCILINSNTNNTPDKYLSILCTISLAISYVSHLCCAHLCAVPTNFNCNDENRIIYK